MDIIYITSLLDKYIKSDITVLHLKKLIEKFYTFWNYW